MKKGLLIGINYVGTSNELNGCINDMTNLKNLLINNKYFTSSELSIMSDKEPISSQLYPTKQNILTQMNNLVNFANSVSKTQSINLFFAYSGHGSYIPDTSGDESDKRDEVLCPIDYQKNGFIVDDVIRSNLINKLNTNVTLTVLIDACHSGTILDLKYNYQCDGKQSCNTQSNLVDTQCNVVMISGCRDNQTSADAYVGHSYQGAMTASFLANYSNHISTENLVINMKTWLKNGGYDQIPQLATGHQINVTTPFVLASYNISDTDIDLIQSAFYGKNSKILDVTLIVKNYFASGQKLLTVSNQLFSDPCVGTVKELSILINGSTIIFPEYCSISLDDIINKTVNQSLLTIQSAYYGKNQQIVNVTNIVKNYFTSGQKLLPISNQLFSDPCVGKVKELCITLTTGLTIIYPENWRISFDDIINNTLNRSLLAIQSAYYGKNQKIINVTNIVKKYFTMGNTTMPISNGLFTDPCVQILKELRIVLVNGTIKTFKENTSVTLSQIVS